MWHRKHTQNCTLATMQRDHLRGTVTCIESKTGVFHHCMLLRNDRALRKAFGSDSRLRSRASTDPFGLLTSLGKSLAPPEVPVCSTITSVIKSYVMMH